MGKSEDKKQYIIENARKVFKIKGFKDVTMKDIIDKCNISRGGIYLYFKSTEEIFKEVLEEEETKDSSISELSQSSSSLDLIKCFLETQKKELLNKDDNLIMATYEYIFYNITNHKDLNLKEKYNIAYETLYRIIKMGVDNNEFNIDINKTVNHIIFLLEGLRVSSLVLTLNEKMINEQIDNILRDFNNEK